MLDTVLGKNLVTRVTCKEGMITNDHTQLLDNHALKFIAALLAEASAWESTAGSGQADTAV